jgi:S1-C subfamily serine protease
MIRTKRSSPVQENADSNVPSADSGATHGRQAPTIKTVRHTATRVPQARNPMDTLNRQPVMTGQKNRVPEWFVGIVVLAALGIGAVKLLETQPVNSGPSIVSKPADKPQFVDPTPSPEMKQAALKASVYIKVITSDGRQSGSGTFITQDGIVLTNYHVIFDDAAGKASKSILVEWNFDDVNGEPNTVYAADLVKGNKQYDFAFLKINSWRAGPKYTKPFPFISMGSSSTLKPGDALSVFGYPASGGLTRTQNDGLVSGFLPDDENQIPNGWIKISIPLHHGNSGGAVIDRTGKLIGVATGAFGNFLERTSVIRPIDLAKEMWDHHQQAKQSK